MRRSCLRGGSRVNFSFPSPRTCKPCVVLLAAVAAGSILFGTGTGIAYAEEKRVDSADASPQPSGATEGASAAATASMQPGNAPAEVDGPAQFFSQKCGGCHTVGKGNLVGPDLVETASWKTDELTGTVKRMEKFVGPLSTQEVDALVKFLKDPRAAVRLKTEEQRAVAAAQTGTEPSSADVGRKLFLGTERFKNRGISCIACHRVEGHGGTMGADLTESFEKFGESALVATCEQPSYPVMKAIYRDQPITRQEALHVTKYLASLKGTTASRPDPPVGQMGMLGAAAFLAGLMFFYRNRNTGVRSRLNRR